MDTERLLGENPSFAAWWWLARSYHAVAGELVRYLDEQGLTGAQFGVIRCLHDAHPESLMLSELSRRLMVTGGNTTGVVTRLEQAGYLKRERNSEDRRVIRARLTPAGEALYQAVMPGIQDRLRSLLRVLSLEEKQCLGSVCEKLFLSVDLPSEQDMADVQGSDPAEGEALPRTEKLYSGDGTTLPRPAPRTGSLS